MEPGLIVKVCAIEFLKGAGRCFILLLSTCQAHSMRHRLKAKRWRATEVVAWNLLLAPMYPMGMLPTMKSVKEI